MSDRLPFVFVRGIYPWDPSVTYRSVHPAGEGHERTSRSIALLYRNQFIAAVRERHPGEALREGVVPSTTSAVRVVPDDRGEWYHEWTIPATERDRQTVAESRYEAARGLSCPGCPAPGSWAPSARRQGMIGDRLYVWAGCPDHPDETIGQGIPHSVFVRCRFPSPQPGVARDPASA